MVDQATGVKELEVVPAAVETTKDEVVTPEQTPENVPYERFNEVNTELKQSKEREAQKDKEKLELLDQINLYRANTQATQAGGQAAAQVAQGALTPDSLYEDLENGDVITVEESKRVTRKLFDAFKEELSVNRFLATHSDYITLCGTPEKMGKWFKESVIKNPAILTEIQSIPNTLSKMLCAYNHSKATKEAADVEKKATTTKEVSPAAQAVLDRSKTPGSPAGVGAGIAGVGKGAHYATMSTDELLKAGRTLASRA